MIIMMTLKTRETMITIKIILTIIATLAVFKTGLNHPYFNWSDFSQIDFQRKHQTTRRIWGKKGMFWINPLKKTHFKAISKNLLCKTVQLFCSVPTSWNLLWQMLFGGMEGGTCVLPFLYWAVLHKFNLNQGNLYTGGRGWCLMCSRQPTVSLAVSKTKQIFFFTLIAYF
jgi:hypothetical protein